MILAIGAWLIIFSDKFINIIFVCPEILSLLGATRCKTQVIHWITVALHQLQRHLLGWKRTGNAIQAGGRSRFQGGVSGEGSLVEVGNSRKCTGRVFRAPRSAHFGRDEDRWVPRHFNRSIASRLKFKVNFPSSEVKTSKFIIRKVSIKNRQYSRTNKKSW